VADGREAVVKMTREQARSALKDLDDAVKGGGGNIRKGGPTHRALQMAIDIMNTTPAWMTPEDIMQALERGDVAHDEEIRIEFSGDDNTPQELVGIERRESEGRRYICIMVRNV
jgi:hypothetical protein